MKNLSVVLSVASSVVGGKVVGTIVVEGGNVNKFGSFRIGARGLDLWLNEDGRYVGGVPVGVGFGHLGSRLPILQINGFFGAVSLFRVNSIEPDRELNAAGGLKVKISTIFRFVNKSGKSGNSVAVS